MLNEYGTLVTVDTTSFDKLAHSVRMTKQRATLRAIGVGFRETHCRLVIKATTPEDAQRRAEIVLRNVCALRIGI